jgi:hypothetical protein
MTKIAREDWRLDNSKGLHLRCPTCGRLFVMIRYMVRDDRTVFPSVCCPDVKCRFLGQVELEGWEPEDAD